jgi:hypothetical protein
MGRSDERFRKFVLEHQARVPLGDWPQLGTEAGETYWNTIRNHLARLGANLEVATAASEELAKAPPVWLIEQQAALLDAVRAELRKRSGDAPREIVVPEPAPGPWDAIRSLEDLKAFLRSVDASTGRGRPDAPGHHRGRRHGQARGLPELANLPAPMPDPHIERERARQRAALSLPPARPDDAAGES